MKQRFKFLQLTLSLIFAVSVLSCGLGGGGGGGGDELVAADVSIVASPRQIDSGDRIRVTIFMSDIKEDGLLLKLRYSSRLAYVRNSSTVTVDGDNVSVNPGANETINNNLTYLVYDLPHSTFGDNDNAQIELILEGQGRLSEGEIEVDADFNDPSQSFSQKFSVLSPEFDPKAFVRVTINDESGEVRPTITRTPTITYTPSLTFTPTNTRTPRPTLTPTPTP